MISPRLLPPDPPPVFDPASLDHLAQYSCLRASPLGCVNQKLAEELNVMRKWRELEGEERSALSYQKAIAVRLSHAQVTSIVETVVLI